MSASNENTEEMQISAFSELLHCLSQVIDTPSSSAREVQICTFYQNLVEAKAVNLFYLDPKNQAFFLKMTTGPQEEKKQGGFLGIEEEDLENLSHHDFKAHDLPLMLYTKENAPLRFENPYLLITPIFIFSEIKGLLIGEYEHPREITEKHRVVLIKIFLKQISPIIESYFKQLELEEKLKKLQLLYDIGDELRKIREGDELLDKIMHLIERHLQVDRGSLMLLDENSQVLKIKKAFGLKGVKTHKIKVKLGEGIAGTVAATGKALLIKNLDEENQLESKISRKHFRTNSLLSAPLIVQGKTIGVINVNDRKDYRPFTEEDKELLSLIGSEIATVLHNSYLELQLKMAKELDHAINWGMV